MACRGSRCSSSPSNCKRWAAVRLSGGMSSFTSLNGVSWQANRITAERWALLRNASSIREDGVNFPEARRTRHSPQVPSSPHREASPTPAVWATSLKGPARKGLSAASPERLKVYLKVFRHVGTGRFLSGCKLSTCLFGTSQARDQQPRKPTF